MSQMEISIKRQHVHKPHWIYIWNCSNTSKAIKSVNSEIRVGGPATGQLKWLGDFSNATISQNLP